MNRTQKLKLNATTSLFNRIVQIISGLILPRLILLYFGSETNGLVASINQFLSIITFLDLGVGSVVQSALYRPLAKRDNQQISKVLSSAKNYFNLIAYVLVAYVFALILFYPLIIDGSSGFISTVFLILALSISLFGQYYFGIVNELLLNANQQSYIQYGSEIVVVILNLLLSVFLITQGASIQVVKLGAGLIFLIRPLYLSYYVRQNFNIKYDIEYDKDPLPQRWHGMGQHIAYSISNSTDIIVLTLFSTLEIVSIYNIHYIVIKSIKMLISSLTTGMGSFFGELLAIDEIEALNNYFDKIEWIVHTCVIFLYGMTVILINSFVQIYTSGVHDVNYYAPLFSLLLILAYAAYSLKAPYQSLIFSAGHFKQTQISSFIEAGLNIIISLIGVYTFGLVGVAFGTMVATVYRTVYLVVYISRNIVFRPLNKFLKHIFVDLLSFGAMFGIGFLIINNFDLHTIIDWFIIAVLVGIVNLLVLFLINMLFYKSTTISSIKGIIRR